MLSETQQLLLLKMLLRYVHDEDALVSRRDCKEFYKGRSSFYRSVQYLINSGLVEKIDFKNNVVSYRLTWKGETLARIICGFPEIPERFKGDSSMSSAIEKWRLGG